MVAGTGRIISLALVLLALGSTPSIVRAQGAFNPYGNSGYADYREFTVPSYSNNPALPGQTRLNSEPLITRPRSNSYRPSLDDEDDGDFESNRARRGSSAGIPYNEAYQQYNRQNNRAYKPNDNKQNQEFVDRMKQRDQDYARALQEKDPVKRSKMLRQIENEANDKSKPKSSTTAKAPEPGATARGTTSRAPAPPIDRRSAAPAPPSGANRGANTSTAPPPPISGSNRARGGSATTTTKPAAPDPSTIAVPPPR